MTSIVCCAPQRGRGGLQVPSPFPFAKEVAEGLELLGGLLILFMSVGAVVRSRSLRHRINSQRILAFISMQLTEQLKGFEGISVGTTSTAFRMVE